MSQQVRFGYGLYDLSLLLPHCSCQLASTVGVVGQGATRLQHELIWWSQQVGFGQGLCDLSLLLLCHTRSTSQVEAVVGDGLMNNTSVESNVLEQGQQP